MCVCVCECFRTPGRMAERTAFASHYFQFASEKDENNITVTCRLCVGEKLLSTAETHDVSVRLRAAVCVREVAACVRRCKRLLIFGNA